MPIERAGLARAVAITTAGLVAASLVAGCSAGAGDASGEGTGPNASRTVTLVTHNSWAMPKPLLADFEDQSGYNLEVVTSGDAGQLTNKLVLTKGNPIGDVVYGIDNTFATRAADEGVLEEHTPDTLAASAEEYTLELPAGDQLTPIDWSDVCVNVDDAWFREHDLTPPHSLDDLTDPRYEDLFVTPAPSTSSPGFAFLLATIGTHGDQWPDYWRDLVDNGARIVSGWEDAYTVDFTAGGGNGDRPIVVSYASSPPFTIPQDGQRPTTSALLDTCFRQVEYAGVLAGTDNDEGARALVDFMTTRAFQEALPDNMYVFPVDARADLPEAWARWATPADQPIVVPAVEIADHRDEWLREWSDVTTR